MSATRAFAEIAYVAGECVAVRDAGFTEAALQFPRSEAGLVALCAFNGCSVEQAPRGWNYYPNAGTKKQWERVIEALWDRAVTAIAIEAPSGGETTKSGSTVGESAGRNGIAQGVPHDPR